MAVFPFNKVGQETILYKNTSPNEEFAIASGYDIDYNTNYPNNPILSVGVRWLISRNERKKKPNKIKFTGFPSMGVTSCWLIMPDDLAICLLNYIKSKSSSANCTINIPEINKTLQTLNQQIVQQNSTQGAKNSSLQKKIRQI